MVNAISPKKESENENRKGILKSTPAREPASKVQKIEIDLDGGAEATDTRADSSMGVPPPPVSVRG